MNYLNIDSLNGEAGGWTNYLWTAGSGISLDLSSESYIVLRDGIDGFSGTSADYHTAQSPNRMRHVLRQSAHAPREFGFVVLIRASDHADLMQKRKILLDAFSAGYGDGVLQKLLPGVGTVTITARSVRGYPDIRGGLPPGSLARSQEVTIRLVAHDPYWYGPVLRQTAVGGLCTVQNTGNAELTPCRIRVAANVVTNTTTGQTLYARSGQTIVGAVVDITDTGVTAELDGANALGRFAYDSQFPMLAPGTNVISGVEWVEFRPRWEGV